MALPEPRYTPVQAQPMVDAIRAAKMDFARRTDENADEAYSEFGTRECDKLGDVLKIPVELAGRFDLAGTRNSKHVEIPLEYVADRVRDAWSGDVTSPFRLGVLLDALNTRSRFQIGDRDLKSSVCRMGPSKFAHSVNMKMSGGDKTENQCWSLWVDGFFVFYLPRKASVRVPKCRFALSDCSHRWDEIAKCFQGWDKIAKKDGNALLRCVIGLVDDGGPPWDVLADGRVQETSLDADDLGFDLPSFVELAGPGLSMYAPGQFADELGGGWEDEWI